jgi:hypothetical protein
MRWATGSGIALRKSVPSCFMRKIPEWLSLSALVNATFFPSGETLYRAIEIPGTNCSL